MRRLSVSAAALLLLTACGKGPDTGSQDAAKGARQAALTSPPLGADGLPRLRPGLWEVTKTGDGETETTRECLGAEANAEVRELLTRQDPDCRIQRSSGAGGLKVSADCQENGVRLQSEFVMTGSETAYDMTLGLYVITPDGERDGGEIHGKARWIGACPAGVAPGQTLEP